MKFSVRVLTKTQAQFWARTFKLEQQIMAAVRNIAAPGLLKSATMPIIAEYEVDPGLKFVYAIVFFVDTLGIHDAKGYVYGCDKDGEEECYQVRDELAKDILKYVEESKHGKAPFVQMKIIPEGKE
jgi:hypothetical protein